jgi:homoserine kinase
MDLSDAQALRIRVPASTSNLGPAFDAVGLALQLYLVVEVKRAAEGTAGLQFHGEDRGLVPTDESNLIRRTLAEVARECGRGLPGHLLRIDNQIPITKGLGSSAAACLAAAVAADFLCGLGLTREQWLRIACDREGHPDNAAPALYGGLVASIAGASILSSRAAFPREWTVVAVTPDFELETKKARAILSEFVARQDAVYNLQRVAFLISQIIQGRREGLREAMRDRLHQPARGLLLPGLQELLEMEDCAGLLGVALSGAGPTVVAFADSDEERIGHRMREVFRRHGHGATVRFLKADNEGLTVEVLPS